MKKIGLLYGMENTFPMALVDRINARQVDGVVAESLMTGAFRMDRPTGYGSSSIASRTTSRSIDRPEKRRPDGHRIINNPFWWSADDKFFNYSLAQRLGVAVPTTVILPHKRTRRDHRTVDAQPRVTRSIGTRSSNTSVFQRS
ncbi:MAG: hypothetical protein QM757_46645 [Paludibaculum sp.]